MQQQQQDPLQATSSGEETPVDFGFESSCVSSRFNGVDSPTLNIQGPHEFWTFNHFW